MSDSIPDDVLAHYGIDVNPELRHFGVKGMKWGVSRADPLSGISGRTKRAARGDANEFAKAKMFYGEGAGTRRKLIKAKVESRSKDPNYKKAFDHYSDGQNMGKRAAQARSERGRKDTVNTIGKTARGVKNLALGTGASVTIGAMAVYAASQNPTVRRIVTNAATTTISTVRNSPLTQMGADYVRSRFG